MLRGIEIRPGNVQGDCRVAIQSQVTKAVTRSRIDPRRAHSEKSEKFFFPFSFLFFFVSQFTKL